MRRPLPSAAEAAAILARKRTRPPRRPPPTAGKPLNTYLRTLEARYPGAGSGPRALREHWRDIVGEILARRTEPVKLVRPKRGGPATLEVRVDGPAAALIQHQAGEILARVNVALGEDAVSRLRVVQGPVRAPPAAGAAAQPGRRAASPLDAAAEAALQADLAAAPEGPLKAALLRLGREVLRRR